MPSKVEYTTRGEVIKLPSPSPSTIISYEHIINKVIMTSHLQGLTVIDESYKLGLNGSLVQMSFIFNNYGVLSICASYNKNIKFKIASGIVNNASLFNIALDNISTCGIKDFALIPQLIEDELNSLSLTVDRLNKFQHMAERINFSNKDVAQLVGRCFIEKNILTVTQMGVIIRYLDEHPPQNSWEFFKCISNALEGSHPTSYIDDNYEFFKLFYEEVMAIHDNQMKNISLDTLNIVSGIPSVIFL